MSLTCRFYYKYVNNLFKTEIGTLVTVIIILVF